MALVGLQPSKRRLFHPAKNFEALKFLTAADLQSLDTDGYIVKDNFINDVSFLEQINGNVSVPFSRARARARGRPELTKECLGEQYA